VGSLIALVSPGGSPGVTTTALALALGWPRAVIVAECDPAGGSVLAGALGGHHPGGVGLMEHAIETGRDPEAAAAGLAAQLVPLDSSQTRMVLPGLTDPRQAAGLVSAWPAVTATLTAQGADVIADCGRMDAGPAQPLPLLAAASAVAVVLRPTLRQVWAARPRVDMLSHLVADAGRLVLIVTGPGSYPAGEVAASLGVPLLAELPADPASAAVLSDGAPQRRNFASGPLLTAARGAASALRQQVSAPEAGALVPVTARPAGR
jgi:hypothetical protein